MAVLVLKNVAHEGPGTIESFLRGKSIPYGVVDFFDRPQVPAGTDYDTLVVMGGPMGVYEMQEYPYLKTEADVIRQALDGGKKVLGICLGAQMVAHCLGASVYKGAKGSEIGWMDVRLTPEGAADPVTGALVRKGEGPEVKVFHWHGDTFDLPKGAVRLAGSALYENQAFRYGEGVYGLQFHIEVTGDMVRQWFSGEAGDHSRVLQDTDRHAEECARRALGFYERFFTWDRPSG